MSGLEFASGSEALRSPFCWIPAGGGPATAAGAGAGVEDVAGAAEPAAVAGEEVGIDVSAEVAVAAGGSWLSVAAGAVERAGMVPADGREAGLAAGGMTEELAEPSRL